jgi:hypothetical protein
MCKNFIPSKGPVWENRPLVFHRTKNIARLIILNLLRVKKEVGEIEARKRMPKLDIFCRNLFKAWYC